MFQCPVCGELMEALTNFHCLTQHHLSKHEVIARHGAAKYVAPRMNREVQQWIRNAQIISRSDFDIAQSAARNQVSH
ncbi:hypothetical protein D2Q93_01715 [Alicyclobacillaceae bacterium I2511]|nr:hypothetical protein D2Q93_01715 [Alicyclobacillaceae bacterium I2511]